jgi:hypothetical protein
MISPAGKPTGTKRGAGISEADIVPDVADQSGEADGLKPNRSTGQSFSH